PRLFGAGPGGAFADRYSGTRVVAGCSVVQAGLTAAIIPAEHAGSAVGIYSAIVGTQLASGIARSALGTIIPGVVPASQLGRANALFGLSTGSSLVVGPALGAPLFLIRGPDLLLGIDAATFVVAALVILRLPRTRVEPERARGAWESFRLVAADPP